MKKIQYILTAGLCLLLSLAGGSEARAAGWQENNGSWYWIQDDGSVKTGWQEADGNWYYLDGAGVMQTGWVQLDGVWYYLDSSGVMQTGWQLIDGKHYYLKADGSMQNSRLQQGETIYSFNSDGSLAQARQEKNRGGGSYTLSCFDAETQKVADELNDQKRELFTGDEKEDYYEDDDKNYDADASYVVSGTLCEIAEHRLLTARQKGYKDKKIPDEGTLSQYMDSIGCKSNSRRMEIFLKGCYGGADAADKLQKLHEKADEKKDDPGSYSEMGIAHLQLKNRDYFMVVLTK